VYGVSYRLTGNMEDAKDITQKVFLKAIENLRKFRGEASFSTYLYRITVNEAINHKRTTERDDHRIQDTSPVQEDTSLSELIREERAGMLREAISQLPHRQRLAVVLRVYEEMSIPEVARIMGISEGAVKSSYHFGIQKLREILRRMGYESLT